ncbi:MAG: DUF4142 domain-containing protein [Bacteroidia bacterium]|nr:DUF4142 domain-containing protein [Bacteroidia bacterium]
MLMGLALMSAGAQAQDSPKLTDPEIASVAVTANQIDVDYGKIALKKATDKNIKNFAQTMIRDHEGVIKQAVDLAGKLGVTPKDNAVTQQLLTNSRKVTADLNSKSGKAFDKAYIDNEVAYHEAVISTVKNVLIPQTQNKELKNLFVTISPVLDSHLAHAKKVQSELK